MGLCQRDPKGGMEILKNENQIECREQQIEEQETQEESTREI